MAGSFLNHPDTGSGDGGISPRSSTRFLIAVTAPPTNY